MNTGFPDVVLTPQGPTTAPVPYGNIGRHSQAAPTAESVRFNGKPPLDVSSKVPVTSGDEAGTAGPNKGAGQFPAGVANVNINGLAAISTACTSTGNNGNNGNGVVVATDLGILLNYAGATAPTGRIDAAGLARLTEPLSAEPIAEEALLGGVGYLRLAVFARGLPAALHDAVRRLGSRGLAALLLDLRGCPGGDLTAAVELAGDFLEPGRVVVTATESDGDQLVHRSRCRRPYPFPLVLLVDRGTASAAELFAGALQAHRRALVVGETTYGKGSAQAVLPSPDGHGAIYATVATLTLPSGVPLQGRGVRPDVEAARDVALDVALEAAAALRPSDPEVR